MTRPARYEKEVEKNKRLKLLLAKCDTELQRWRRGEAVSEEEQTRIRDGSEAAKTQAGFDLSPSPSTASISNLLGVTNASEAERIAFVKVCCVCVDCGVIACVRVRGTAYVNDIRGLLCRHKAV